jgi:hypothetical protein
MSTAQIKYLLLRIVFEDFLHTRRVLAHDIYEHLVLHVLTSLSDNANGHFLGYLELTQTFQFRVVCWELVTVYFGVVVQISTVFSPVRISEHSVCEG